MLGLIANAAMAEGVSAYLPLNLEPEMERQIERVLILADEPILKRPFAVALVEDALPQACMVDEALVQEGQEVSAALLARLCRYPCERHRRDHARRDGDVVPNEHGLPESSHWELSAQGYVQPNDYVLVSAGAIAYKGRTVPTGSMLSLGFNWAQLDIGYRDHWLSPATDSSMLLSTEAPTMPSVTLSNYEPLTRLGFQYEFFLARMEQVGEPEQTATISSTTAREASAIRASSVRSCRSSPSAAGRSASTGISQYGGGSGCRIPRAFWRGISSSPAACRRRRAINRPPTSAASSFRAKRPLRCISSTRAKTPRTAAATCWAMRRSPPASISRGSRATST